MGTLQTYLARTIVNCANDLIAAVERLPEDKRDWSAMGGARSALDQAAECALLNGAIPEMLKARAWDQSFYVAYEGAKSDLKAQGWEAVKSQLLTNSARAAEAAQALDDKDLAISIDCPWGPMTLELIAAYPYWNTCYHEGQVNYIASMLGCL